MSPGTAEVELNHRGSSTPTVNNNINSSNLAGVESKRLPSEYRLSDFSGPSPAASNNSAANKVGRHIFPIELELRISVRTYGSLKLAIQIFVNKHGYINLKMQKISKRSGNKKILYSARQILDLKISWSKLKTTRHFPTFKIFIRVLICTF